MNELELSLLGDEGLRELYHQKWKGTHSAFCQKYEVNRANFGAWLKGVRRTSPSSSNAVRRFLLDTESNTQRSHCAGVEVTDADDVIKERLSEISAVVYIDGDNAATHLDALSIILRGEQRRLIVICVLSKGGSNTMAFGMSAQFPSWFFLIRAKTTAKDATDQALVCLTMAHHFLMIDRPDVPFLLLSRDRFMPEPQAQLKSRGRKCLIADGFSVTPAVALLALQNIPLKGILSPLMCSHLLEHIEAALEKKDTFSDRVVEVQRELLKLGSLEKEALATKLACKILGRNIQSQTKSKEIQSL